MYRILIVFAICIFSFSVGKTQIGFSVTYNTPSAENWETVFQNANSEFNFHSDYQLPNSIGYSLDYWFRLKTYRIEFFPTIHYVNFEDVSSYVSDPIGDMTLINRYRQVDFSFHTSIYFLDFEGDCDCPTFSKDGNAFGKGIYAQLSPGFTFNQFHLNYPLTPDETQNTSIVPHLGLGVGLDLGFSDFFTLTPFARYTRHFNVEWEMLNDLLAGIESNGDNLDANPVNQLQFGIRLGLRYKK